jgi:hypothetical protein
MSYYEKYLKYKSKYLILQQEAGMVRRNAALHNIKSIGFEFETSEMAPVIYNKIDNTISPYGFNSITGSLHKHNLGIYDKGEILLTQDSYNNENLENEYEKSKEDFDVDANIGFALNTLFKLEKIEEVEDDNDEVKPKKRKLDNIRIIKSKLDKTYGHTEFIMTFKKVANNINTIYNKTNILINFVELYLDKLKPIKKINVLDAFNKNHILYLYEFDTGIENETSYNCFLSTYPYEFLKNINFSLQITIGASYRNIVTIIEYLIADYNNYNKTRGSEINNIKTIDDISRYLSFIDHDLYINNKTYLLLLFSFLNVKTIEGYLYDNDILAINREHISIKPRFTFKNLKNYILGKEDLRENMNNLITYVRENQQKFKNNRIFQLRSLITNYLLEKKIINKHNAQIIMNNDNINLNSNNIYTLFGNLDEESKNNLLSILNTKLRLTEKILNEIIEADVKFIIGEYEIDPIDTGGTRYDITDNILYELRYIPNKFPLPTSTLDDYKKVLEHFNSS